MDVGWLCEAASVPEPDADVIERSNRIIDGEAPAHHARPFRPGGTLTEVADGVASVDSFANVAAFTTDEGLLLVDTGSAFAARQVHEAVRGWTDQPLHTAVYTHGHVDHVFGTAVFEEENAHRGVAPPRVVAHELVDPRFDRYVLTAGYNEKVNQRQFQSEDLRWPVVYRRPDETYRERLDLEVGGVRAELHHARGETDDHTWTWFPTSRVVCPGDLVIWCAPNAGNPQKVQRFALDWAVALREMAALEPELLLPGHGLPVSGAHRVQAVLLDTAALLESLHDQTLELMNEGATLDEVLHVVQAPPDLLDKPYLQPIYDEPEFVVRNVWRLYGGWYDGNPAHLKPAPDAALAALAAELASLAGGVQPLVDRARALLTGDDPEQELRLAGHLAELAAQADPDHREAQRARAEVNEARRGHERSLMARGIYSWAAHESRRRLAELEGPTTVPASGTDEG
jgi:alkyl sulfatase BDS1-like metallo-beta-lactamase superfamily hydrolase